MIFTINTYIQQIEIHGSFKFEDLEALKKQLPEEWRSYSISLAEPVHRKTLELPNPPYPLVPYYYEQQSVPFVSLNKQQ